MARLKPGIDSDAIHDQGGRLGRLGIDPEFLVGICSGTYEVAADPLPADAVLRWSYFDGADIEDSVQ